MDERKGTFRRVILPRIGIAVLVTLVLGIIGGILESNIVQGDYIAKYGTVPVPGSKVLHLPSKTVDVRYAVLLPGRGNETPDVPVPRNLGLAVTAVDPGAPAPTVKRDVGSSENSGDVADTDTAIQLWKVEVKHDGDYRVTARGGSFHAVNPKLLLGSGPAVPIGFVFLGAFVIGVLVAIFWPQIFGLFARLRSRGEKQEVDPGRLDGDAVFANVDGRMKELEDLHSRGVLSDEEYDAEQKKLIDNL
jgi:hypothetical protein